MSNELISDLSCRTSSTFSENAKSFILFAEICSGDVLAGMMEEDLWRLYFALIVMCTLIDIDVDMDDDKAILSLEECHIGYLLEILSDNNLLASSSFYVHSCRKG